MCKEIIGGKARYLPEVNAGERHEEAPPVVGKYPCPCCGNITLPVPQDEAIAYICPVCWWENDVFILSEDEPSDENHGMTLREARRKVQRFGSCRVE